jgi:hypothetical protein
MCFFAEATPIAAWDNHHDLPSVLAPRRLLHFLYCYSVITLYATTVLLGPNLKERSDNHDRTNEGLKVVK